MDTQQQPKGFHIGPRSTHGVFGSYLPTSSVIVIGSFSAVALIAVLAIPSIIGLIIGAVLFLIGSTAGLQQVGTMTVSDFAPHAITYLKRRMQGRTRYVTPALGAGATQDGEDARPVHPASAPESVEGIEILSIDAGTRTIGVAHDPAERTLCGVLKINLGVFGLLDDADQIGRLESFGDLLDDLANPGTGIQRLALLKRTVPRKINEQAEYLDNMIVAPRDHPAVRSLFEVVRTTAEVAQEHEVFIVVQMPATVRLRSWRNRPLEEQRQQAGRMVLRQLQRIAQRLQEANIAVRSVDGALTPESLARMIKDSYDPFGRRQRDEYDRMHHTSGLPVDRAWPTSTHERFNVYRAEDAWHVSWWIDQWPARPVAAGFLQPLTLQPDVPVLTLAIVWEPRPIGKALHQAERRRTADQAAAHDRQKNRRTETTLDVDRRLQGDREEQELRSNRTPWRREMFITTSVPVGDEDGLEHAVQEVQTACTRAHLHPLRVFCMQERLFTFTLPLARGLR